jgi:hypothetical protein
MRLSQLCPVVNNVMRNWLQFIFMLLLAFPASGEIQDAQIDLI